MGGLGTLRFVRWRFSNYGLALSCPHASAFACNTSVGAAVGGHGMWRVAKGGLLAGGWVGVRSSVSLHPHSQEHL